MEGTRVEKMKITERAKQFMPFSPLKGYDELLLERTLVKSDKIEISEEKINEISEVLSVVKKKDIVSVVYYDKNSYRELTGLVSKIDEVDKIIRIIKTQINFDDIYSIEIRH